MQQVHHLLIETPVMTSIVKVKLKTSSNSVLPFFRLRLVNDCLKNLIKKPPFMIKSIMNKGQFLVKIRFCFSKI